jgi:hypothetical protein
VYVGDKNRQSLQNTPKATNATVVDKNKIVFVAKVYLLKAFFLSSSSSFLLLSC